MEQQVKDDIQRVFQLQKKQQKALRASTAEQRREKLAFSLREYQFADADKTIPAL